MRVLFIMDTHVQHAHFIKKNKANTHVAHAYSLLIFKKENAPLPYA